MRLYLPTRDWDVRWVLFLCSMGGILFVLQSTQTSAQTPSAEQVEFFEKSIRPVLADNCYRCHGEDAEELKGGLNLTYREGLLSGGDSGPTLVPGEIEKSLIVEAIEYGDEDFRMPPKEKLAEEAISSIKKWIAMGAPDPRDQPLAQGGLEDDKTWAAVREQRQKWWSFQPVQQPQPPNVAQANWAKHPVDRFIRAKIDAAGLSPAPLADARTLLRRLTYTLTGLPPTPEESEQFVAAEAIDHEAAVEAAVDRLLASVHFGERWARRWMDWMRYAETHGSEGDPAIPFAWRYRDYLIRALNADVPYDQLVREHLAGDILPEPRINRELKINESVLGTAQYRFVLHGYSPTDVLAEQVRFTENQIDVITKGFLGLTVACARCHNHKFDPISQEDFYALYGIMASTRPATVTVDTPELLNSNKKELAALKPRLRTVLSEAWLIAIDEIPRKLLHPEGAWQEALEAREEGDGTKPRAIDPLYGWRQLRNLDGAAFLQEWKTLREAWQTSKVALRARKEFDYDEKWDLTGDQAASWYGHGNGLTSRPSPAGEFHVLAEGDRIVSNILPAGMYSHTLSTKHNAILASPRFLLDGSKIFVRVVGSGSAAARYVVQNYPRRGPQYDLDRLEKGKWSWLEWDVAYWAGDHMYLEMATAADQPVGSKGSQERSWFGITEALVLKDGQPLPRDELAEFISPLFEAADAPTSAEALAERYAIALHDCVTAWRDGVMNDSQARFLDYFVVADLLPNALDEVPTAESLLVEYRKLEQEVPVPTRAPGVLEGNSFDQPLFVHGDHHQPSDPVPRRFLDFIDGTPYDTADAGRAALAESILDPSNPLTRRVIANRLWHHVFGRGIVATPDNFGKLGEPPSHPELLDYLANRFVEDGCSIKDFLRSLVTSRTFQLSATPSTEARAVDPLNRLLSHASVRRLEGEAIRDSLLKVAGRLDPTNFGEPVDGNANRRSVYVQVVRNDLDPFLSIFDVPVPTSTVGRRNATNVPAQALAMMNAPLVIDLAGAFALRTQNEDPDPTQASRIARMFELALGRPPLPGELVRAKQFLERVANSEPSYNDDQIQIEITKFQERFVAVYTKAQERALRFLNKNPEAVAATPAPIAAWDFDEDGRDRVGSLHAELRGGARIENGVLVLDSDGANAVTSLLGRKLTEKTLEIWVQPVDREQQGHVMMVRTQSTGAYDGIGLSTTSPHLWLASSDRDLHRPEAAEKPREDCPGDVIHVAITYSRGGAMTCYRNGSEIGTAFDSTGGNSFSGGDSLVQFGIPKQHEGPAFRGRILAARLYNVELSDEEILILVSSMGEHTPKERLRQLLSTGDRKSLATLESDFAQLMRCAGPRDPWRELAHAIFNMKEFIYLK